MLGIRSTLFDITARKRLERERDRIFTLSRDLLCVVGSDGHLSRVNDSWERVLGFTPKELAAEPFMSFVHPDDCAATLAAYEGQLTRGDVILSFENRYRCKNGAYRVLQWNSTPVASEGVVYGSARDITEQKRADDALRAAHAAAEAANQELEAFSYSVSHDLRAPLRAIVGFSGILEDGYGEKIDEEGNRLIGVIRENGQRMGQLIDDLLAFSRLGRKPIAASRIAMAQLADDVFREIAPLDDSPPIDWHVQPMPEAWGDPALLRQVWANLLSNAVKFSGRSSKPVIEVGGRSEGGFSVYYVRDNGAGFDMKYYSKLFGVFQRLHAHEEFPGTGVGLAIVQRVVSRHGGRVWAEAAPGKGATFLFTLPEGGSPRGPV